MNTKALYRMWQGRKQIYVIPVCKIESGTSLYHVGYYAYTGIPLVNWQVSWEHKNYVGKAPCDMQPNIAYPIDYVPDTQADITHLEKCLALPAKEK